MTGAVVCRCGRTMGQRTLEGVSYWHCDDCDETGLCRRCKEPAQDDDRLVPATGVGLEHVACPGTPAATCISNLRAEVELQTKLKLAAYEIQLGDHARAAELEAERDRLVSVLDRVDVPFIESGLRQIWRTQGSLADVSDDEWRVIARGVVALVHLGSPGEAGGE